MTESTSEIRKWQQSKSHKFRAIGLSIAIGLPFAFIASGRAQSQEPFYQSEQYSVSADRVVEGPYSAQAMSPTEIVSNYPVRRGSTEPKATWTLQADLSGYPEFRSGTPLLDAIYNLSLSEFAKDVSEEGTFDAGAQWPGAWTRDVSYSILLSLAAIDPQQAKATLLRKVKNDRIVQDTGTGGSWPVSTDRVCWAMAAWEIYLVTGERQWLQQSSVIVENSMRDDEQVVIDPVTGLAHGESSFMDWREQTYPRWMQPVDIYSSENLGTNAVYYRAYRVLAAMDRELGKPAQDWDAKADRIRSAMNERMWMKDRGLYGQYLYGRVWQTLSPRSDALGESLSVLFDIPSPAQQEEILRSQPLMPFGIPTVYPETPNIPPYHNRSVWPFVQAFWNLASAKQGNETALLYGLASMYRSTALFLTNKENFVADTGSPIGTEVNSDRQLWSVAGNLAMVYRVFFGMEFATDGLHLHPVIPEPLKGVRTLTNFHYRNAVLSFQVNGFGNRVRHVTMDGKATNAIVPTGLVGSHSIVIEMDERPQPTRPIHLVENTVAPETPSLNFSGGALSWEPVENATKYQLYKGGRPDTVTSSTAFTPTAGTELTQYQVAAVSETGVSSFLSVPVAVSGRPLVFPASTKGSDSFVTIEQTGKTGLSIAGSVPKPGDYSLSFRYANGSGPINTSNMCAVRTLFVDDKEIGPVVMPQRGSDMWDDWGMSDAQVVRLSAGTHRFELRLLRQDLNMNGEISRALVSSISLMPLNNGRPIR